MNIETQLIIKKIKCEDLQWTLETHLKNSFENGDFDYNDWKRLEAKFKIW